MKRRCTISYCGINWLVEGGYYKGRPAKNYLPNGDPGYPAEPSELLDVEVWIEQGRVVSDDLSPILEADALDTIIDRALAVFDEDDDDLGIPF